MHGEQEECRNINDHTEMYIPRYSWVAQLHSDNLSLGLYLTQGSATDPEGFHGRIQKVFTGESRGFLRADPEGFQGQIQRVFKGESRRFSRANPEGF